MNVLEQRGLAALLRQIDDALVGNGFCPKCYAYQMHTDMCVWKDMCDSIKEAITLLDG